MKPAPAVGQEAPPASAGAGLWGGGGAGKAEWRWGRRSRLWAGTHDAEALLAVGAAAADGRQVVPCRPQSRGTSHAAGTRRATAAVAHAGPLLLLRRGQPRQGPGAGHPPHHAAASRAEALRRQPSDAIPLVTATVTARSRLTAPVTAVDSVSPRVCGRLY